MDRGIKEKLYKLRAQLKTGTPTERAAAVRALIQFSQQYGGLANNE
jgi:hypothetical protein